METSQHLQNYQVASHSAPRGRAVNAKARRLQKILSLNDFEVAAKKLLPKPIYAYVSGGCEDNHSRQGNVQAFDDYRWQTRVFVNSSQRSLSQTLFGRQWDAPFGIAPMGISAVTAYQGDTEQAYGAQAANIPFTLSGSSLMPMEAVAKANPNTWFQAYVPGEPERILALIERVKAAGIGTLVVTADVSVSGNRENNIRAGFSTPLRPSLSLAWQGVTHPWWLWHTAFKTILKHGVPHFENSSASRGAPIIARSVLRDFGARDHLSWEHFDLFRKAWSGNLIVKGILSVEDAQMAKARGADGVILSNHGGRQLDRSAAPLHVLPKVVQALGEGYPVMVDSGFRRGSDVLMAIALGAKFVFVGRPFNYACAVAGRQGVHHAAGILASEMFRNMALLGITSMQDLHPDRLCRLFRES